ncbi:MAG: hypothetical protein FJ266_12015 [Planctomycetes bacterium]|nr:hypothetical protein [Planctomycetota bacterium]
MSVHYRFNNNMLFYGTTRFINDGVRVSNPIKIISEDTTTFSREVSKKVALKRSYTSNLTNKLQILEFLVYAGFD